MNTRILGALLIVGTLVVTLNGFRAESLDLLGNVAYVLWGIGGICGIIGLIRLNALGSNAVARAFGFLPMIGFLAFVLGDGLRLVGFISADEPLYFTLAAIAWIGMLAGMLVVGILTIAAKTWRGWRRFVPLLTVVMVPVAFGLGEAVSNSAVGGAIAFLAWLLLGYVIATAEEVPVLQQTVQA